MNEDKWKTNHFADPDVRKVITDLQVEVIELKTKVSLLTDYTAWVEATYPNMRAEYQAIQDLEDAGIQHLGFTQAQAKAEGSHVPY